VKENGDAVTVIASRVARRAWIETVPPELKRLPESSRASRDARGLKPSIGGTMQNQQVARRATRVD